MDCSVNVWRVARKPVLVEERPKTLNLYIEDAEWEQTTYELEKVMTDLCADAGEVFVHVATDTSVIGALVDETFSWITMLGMISRLEKPPPASSGLMVTCAGCTASPCRIILDRSI